MSTDKGLTIDEMLAAIKRDINPRGPWRGASVKSDLPEFAEAAGQRWAKSRRVAYLKNEIPRMAELLDQDMREINAIMPEWFRSAAVEIRDIIRTGEKIQSMQKELSYLRSCLCRESRGLPVINRGVEQFEIDKAKNADIASMGLFADSPMRCGSAYRVLCPFHQEKTPSLILYPPPRGFYCFGCQKGGDNIALVRELLSMSFVEAVKFLQ